MGAGHQQRDLRGLAVGGMAFLSKHASDRATKPWMVVPSSDPSIASTLTVPMSLSRSARMGVVMAGGHGERFWPLSTPDRPKQLLHLTDSGRSMLDDTVMRIEPLVEAVFVSTTVPLARSIERSGSVSAGRVLGEPARRSTLGALVWTVANLVAQGHSNATVAVVTADHAIGDDAKFQQAAEAALEVAETVGGLVTLGIRPTRPETGYGYIEFEVHTGFAAGNGSRVFRSQAFKEKPDAVTASVYMGSGHHLWNSGMFFFTVPEFLSELLLAAPESHRITLDVIESLLASDHARAAEEFTKLPDLSIDYALLERAEKVHVIPVDFPWDDVGAWDSLERTMASDESGNVTKGRAFTLDVSSCIVVNDDPDRAVALIGLENLVVVNTPQAVLVCNKAQTQRVKQLVAMIAKAEEDDTDHPT